MHILEIPSFFPPYGGAFCLEQAKALGALGHEVRILSRLQLGVSKGWRDYLLRPYAPVVERMDDVEVWRDYQRGWPKTVRLNAMHWLNGVQRLAETYRQQYGCPDVIHAHCVKWAGRAAMMLSERWGVPYVITEHLSAMIYAQELGGGTADAWQTPLLREAMERADKVVVVSDELVDDLALYFGREYAHQTISNMVDTDFFCSVQRQRTDTFRYCAIGNFELRKGYDLLAEAFRLIQQQGIKARLTLVGEGTDSASCHRLFAGVRDVRFYGATDKYGVREVLYDSDALVLPTRSEAQGLVLLEAMSTGIPVVTTDAVPRRVSAYSGCLTVPKERVPLLAEAMLRVTKMPFSAQQIVKEIARNCSPTVIGKRLEQLFLGLV